MKSSCFLLCVACATLTWAQTSGPTTPSPSTSTALKPRGPEAVAKQDPNRIVATIDGKSITAKQALDLLKPLSPEDRKRYEANLPALVQQAYMRDQLAEAGAKLNLDQQSPWKEQIQNARSSILAQAYLSRMTTTSGAAAVDPKQYYDSHPEEFDEVKLSGIFVSFTPPGTPASKAGNSRTEEQARDKANDLEKKIKNGMDFATVARTDSDNQQSGAQGGALGTFAVGSQQIPAEVKKAILALKAGEVSEPVRVPSAFLILKVDTRNKLTYDQAKTSIEQKAQADKNQTVIKQELDKYKVQVQDPDFFNASNAPPIPSLQRPAASPAAPGTPKPPSK